MSSVQVANSLQMGSVDTPLDARTRITALTNVPDIALPYVGMVFFCSATGRHYKVKTLKSKQIGAAVQPDAAVDTYEPVPDQSDLEGKAAKSHTHTEYALKTELPDLTGYLTVSTAEASYAVKSHTHELSDLSDVADLSKSYAAKNHTHTEYALKTELPDLTGYLTVSTAAATYAAKDHSHAGYENRLSTLETASAAIFHLGLVRPNYDDALHLRIEKNGTAVVDTANTADRAKVKIFTGQEWVEFPSDGAGSPFSEMSVDIDLTTLGGGTHYLRYKWYNSSTGTDWVGVTFPSSGNSGGAGGGSGASDFSVYIDPTTNNWIINGEDSGVCAVGTLNVVTSIPDNPVEGTLLIT
ncbi:MAG: hypothetical protein V8T90_05195 [Victivallales bacterium]